MADAEGRLCESAAAVLAMTGAGIALITPAGAHRLTVCSTDAVSALVEDLQFSYGEGPCVDAFNHDRPVGEADLPVDGSIRWPAFSPPAVSAGVAAVFGFPLRVAGVRLGALNLYRDHIGPLSSEQHEDALVVADVLANQILAIQQAAPPGTLAAGLVDGSDQRLVVHQASGMIAVQIDASVDDALLRLRAYSFAHDETMSVVATRVVNRELSFQ